MRKLSILFFKELLVQIVVSFLLIVVFSFIAFRMNLNDKIIADLILIIYGISSFIGGLLVAKASEKRKFLWGLVAGLLYFSIIIFISFIITGHIGDKSINIIAGFLVSAICGMLGGMIA